MQFLPDMSHVKLILFDVDGVLTDGTIFISENGEPIKAFNVKDGLAIELLHCHGIKTGVISGKASPALTYRCEKLGFDCVATGCKNKLSKIDEICQQLKTTPAEIIFCGDDVPDLAIMQHCGIGCAPVDSHALVLESADLVLCSKGGEGLLESWLT